MKCLLGLLRINRIVKLVRNSLLPVNSDLRDRAIVQIILDLNISILLAFLLVILFLRFSVICLPRPKGSLIRSKFNWIMNNISTSCVVHACLVAVFGLSSRRDYKEITTSTEREWEEIETDSKSLHLKL